MGNKTLVDRLNGIYTVPVNDGAGLLDGRDTHTRTFEVPRINKEAAKRIVSLEKELKEVKEKLAYSERLLEESYANQKKGEKNKNNLNNGLTSI